MARSLNPLHRINIRAISGDMNSLIRMNRNIVIAPCDFSSSSKSYLIVRPAKLTAVSVICVSWLLVILRGSPVGVIAFTGLLFIGCISFLLSRPEPGSR